MSEYVRVNRRLWNEPDFRGLSDHAKILWTYITTSPHGNMIGLFVLRPGYTKEDLGWADEKFLAAFAELKGENRDPQARLIEPELPDPAPKEFIGYDDCTGLVLIRDFLEHNPLQNPNQIKAALNKIAELPRSPLLEELARILEDLGAGTYEQVIQALRRRAENGTRTTGERLGNGSRTVGDSETESVTGTETETRIPGEPVGDCKRTRKAGFREGEVGYREPPFGPEAGRDRYEFQRRDLRAEAEEILRDLKIEGDRELPAARTIAANHDRRNIRMAILATRDAMDGIPGGVKNRMAYFQNELRKLETGTAAGGGKDD